MFYENLNQKDFDIVGYGVDGEVFCPGCTENKEDPIFAGTETDCRYACSKCGYIIESVLSGGIGEYE